MPDTPKDITWYDIAKDVIIPLLGVLTTIVLGTIIAYLLKGKEEKSKTKTLLIDNYMLYLDAQMKFVTNELISIRYQIFKDIFLDYNQYFVEHANDHLSKEQIGKLRDRLKVKVDEMNPKDTVWSIYTYRFAFLLGKKTYNKHVQSLEDNVVQKYISKDARTNLLKELKEKIVKDAKVVEEMKSVNINMIIDAIDRIEFIISDKYNSYQFSVFNSFDTKIADLIDQY